MWKTFNFERWIGAKISLVDPDERVSAEQTVETPQLIRKLVPETTEKITQIKQLET